MKQKITEFIKWGLKEIALFTFLFIAVILTMIGSVLMAFYLYFVVLPK